MAQFSVAEHFSEVVAHVGKPVHALGYVHRKPSVWEQVQSLLIASAIGVIAKSFLHKEKRQYLALTDGSLVLLEFADDEFVESKEFALDQVENGSAAVDESLVKLSFGCGGQDYNIELMRYQLVDLDGSMMSDPELMRQIGAMTARIGTSLQTRRLAA